MFTRGQEALTDLNKKKVDLKTAFYRMKENDSHKVRVLGLQDFVGYHAHSDYAKKIFTQTCSHSVGECALCKAQKSGVADFEGLYPRQRFLFVFGDLATGELRCLDVSKNQAKALISSLQEYSEDINELCFNLKKTGSGTNTAYSLSPVLKMKGDEPAQFDALAELEVTDEYLSTVLAPRPFETQVKILSEAGFPVKEYFPQVNLEEESQEDDLLANI